VVLKLSKKSDRVKAILLSHLSEFQMDIKTVQLQAPKLDILTNLLPKEPLLC
jgi:hypothetical protein